MSFNSNKWFISLSFIVYTLILSACGSNLRPDSPDVRYRSAAEFEQLLLPPDTIGERGQLYVIPKARGKISRSSILPATDAATFERHGQLSWLAIKAPVEALWPELVAFIEHEGYALEINDSLTGTLVTAWRQPQVLVRRNGLMQKIFGAKKNSVKNELERYVLRLERAASNTSRLFARYNVSKKIPIDNGAVLADKSWQIQNQDPERTSQLLTRILTYIGIEEQQANDILSLSDVSEINHGLQLGVAKNEAAYLLMWDEYESAFERVRNAVNAIGFTIKDDDLDKGQIETVGKTEYFAKLHQQQSEEKSKGFFSSLKRMFSLSRDAGVELVLNMSRVESHVFALKVLDNSEVVLKGKPGQLFLEEIRDAILKNERLSLKV